MRREAPRTTNAVVRATGVRPALPAYQGAPVRPKARATRLRTACDVEARITILGFVNDKPRKKKALNCCYKHEKGPIKDTRPKNEALVPGSRRVAEQGRCRQDHNRDQPSATGAHSERFLARWAAEPAPPYRGPQHVSIACRTLDCLEQGLAPIPACSADFASFKVCGSSPRVAHTWRIMPCVRLFRLESGGWRRTPVLEFLRPRQIDFKAEGMASGNFLQNSTFRARGGARRACAQTPA